MNSGTSFVLIVSLLLAMVAAGGAQKEQAGVNSTVREVPPSKIVLNHNETVLRDTGPVQQASIWSNLLTSIQTFFSARPVPGGCEEFGCGTNHNETMLRETAPVQQASIWSNLLTSIQTFFSPRPVPGGCEEFGCGGNHNETMLVDLA